MASTERGITARSTTGEGIISTASPEGVPTTAHGFGTTIKAGVSLVNFGEKGSTFRYVYSQSLVSFASGNNTAFQSRGVYTPASSGVKMAGYGEQGPTVTGKSNGSLVTTTGGGTTTTYFKMIGQDHNTAAVDTWIVTGTPDFTGASYTGSLTTPLRNIAIAATWTV